MSTKVLIKKSLWSSTSIFELTLTKVGLGFDETARPPAPAVPMCQELNMMQMWFGRRRRRGNISDPELFDRKSGIETRVGWAARHWPCWRSSPRDVETPRSRWGHPSPRSDTASCSILGSVPRPRTWKYCCYFTWLKDMKASLSIYSDQLQRGVWQISSSVVSKDFEWNRMILWI